MKKICFEKINDTKKHIKKIFIRSVIEDQNCLTRMKKSFIYKVDRTDQVDLNLQPPQVNIKKVFDTRKNIEIFYLRVQGRFFMTHHRALLEVHFQHTLHIEIRWKTKKISPKKSEALT